MVEIGQFFESALRSQSAELKKAAMQAVANMGGSATIRDLLGSEAGQMIRQLSLRDLRDSLSELELESSLEEDDMLSDLEAEATELAADDPDGTRESEQARMFREIVDALGHGPATIGQLSKDLDIDSDELRGYLDWMRSVGKVFTTGRARATRYNLQD